MFAYYFLFHWFYAEAAFGQQSHAGLLNQQALLGQNQGLLGQNIGLLGQNQGFLGQNQGLIGHNPGLLSQNPGLLGQNPSLFQQSQGQPGKLKICYPLTAKITKMRKNKYLLKKMCGPFLWFWSTGG